MPDSDAAPGPERALSRTLLTADNAKWLVATLVIPAVAYWLNHEADRRAKIQEKADRTMTDARRDADELTALLPALTSKDDDARAVALLILQSIVRSDAQRESQLQETLDSIREMATRQQSSGNAEQMAAGVKTLEVLTRGDPAAQPRLDQPPVAPSVAAAPQASSAYPSVAYIQIYSGSQAVLAGKLAGALRSDGVAVPGIENVLAKHGPRILRFAQRDGIAVRFFHQEDMAGALGVAQQVRETLAGQERASTQFVDHGPTTPAGQVEVWFPCEGPIGQPTCEAEK